MAKVVARLSFSLNLFQFSHFLLTRFLSGFSQRQTDRGANSLSLSPTPKHTLFFPIINEGIKKRQIQILIVIATVALQKLIDDIFFKWTLTLKGIKLWADNKNDKLFSTLSWKRLWCDLVSVCWILIVICCSVLSSYSPMWSRNQSTTVSSSSPNTAGLCSYVMTIQPRPSRTNRTSNIWKKEHIHKEELFIR